MGRDTSRSLRPCCSHCVHDEALFTHHPMRCIECEPMPWPVSRMTTCRADKVGFCLWSECPAGESIETDPCPLPMPDQVGREATCRYCGGTGDDHAAICLRATPEGREYAWPEPGRQTTACSTCGASPGGQHDAICAGTGRVSSRSTRPCSTPACAGGHHYDTAREVSLWCPVQPGREASTSTGGQCGDQAE